MVSSLTAQEIVERAKECYELGLIDQQKLEYVTRRAETETGYSPIIDLPLSYEIEHERELRRRARRSQRRSWWWPW